jgi:hypothetical protein
MAQMGTIRLTSKIDALLDEIKDEIDRLHEIASVKRTRDAARDLVEYIQLHHLDGGS